MFSLFPYSVLYTLKDWIYFVQMSPDNKLPSMYSHEIDQMFGLYTVSYPTFHVDSNYINIMLLSLVTMAARRQWTRGNVFMTHCRLRFSRQANIWIENIVYTRTKVRWFSLDLFLSRLQGTFYLQYLTMKFLTLKYLEVDKRNIRFIQRYHMSYTIPLS